MKKGIHFEAVLVVNKVNDKYRIIDGNHRVEAMKLFFDLHPKAIVKIYFAKYEDLSISQDDNLRKEKIRAREREIYTIWNKATPENATDYLKQYFKVIPLGEEILKKLPVSVYGSNSKIKIKDLVGNHILAKKQNIFSGGYAGKGELMVRDFKKLDIEDLKTINAFYKDYVEIFGVFIKGSPYYRTTPFSTFYRIWFDNCKQMSRSKFVGIFKAVIKDKWSLYDENSKSGGSSASQMFYRLTLEMLNQRKGVNFLSDKDIKKDSLQI